VVWREQQDHFTLCYFCSTTVDDHNSKSIHTVVYPNIPLALRPVEHDNSLPISKPPQQRTLHEDLTNTSPEDELGHSCSNVDPHLPELTVSQLIMQSELNDLVAALNFSITVAKPLLLVQWDGICHSKVSKCYTGKASSHCLHFVSKDGELVIVML